MSQAHNFGSLIFNGHEYSNAALPARLCFAVSLMKAVASQSQVEVEVVIALSRIAVSGDYFVVHFLFIICPVNCSREIKIKQNPPHVENRTLRSSNECTIIAHSLFVLLKQPVGSIPSCPRQVSQLVARPSIRLYWLQVMKDLRGSLGLQARSGVNPAPKHTRTTPIPTATL